MNEEILFLIISVRGCTGGDYRLKAAADVGISVLELGQEAPLKGWPSLIYR